MAPLTFSTHTNSHIHSRSNTILYLLLLPTEGLYWGSCVLSTVPKGSSRIVDDEWQYVSRALYFFSSLFPEILGIGTTDLQHSKLLFFLPLVFHCFLPYFLIHSLSVSLSLGPDPGIHSSLYSKSCLIVFSLLLFFTLHLGRHSIN